VSFQVTRSFASVGWTGTSRCLPILTDFSTLVRVQNEVGDEELAQGFERCVVGAETERSDFAGSKLAQECASGVPTCGQVSTKLTHHVSDVVRT
jgi:hypothetical protein